MLVEINRSHFGQLAPANDVILMAQQPTPALPAADRASLSRACAAARAPIHHFTSESQSPERCGGRRLCPPGRPKQATPARVRRSCDPLSSMSRARPACRPLPSTACSTIAPACAARTREIVHRDRPAARLHLRAEPAPAQAAPRRPGGARLDFVLPVGTNTFIKMLHQQIELQGAGTARSRRPDRTPSKASTPIRSPARCRTCTARPKASA